MSEQSPIEVLKIKLQDDVLLEVSVDFISDRFGDDDKEAFISNLTSYIADELKGFYMEKVLN